MSSPSASSSDNVANETSSSSCASGPSFSGRHEAPHRSVSLPVGSGRVISTAGSIDECGIRNLVSHDSAFVPSSSSRVAEIPPDEKDTGFSVPVASTPSGPIASMSLTENETIAAAVVEGAGNGNDCGSTLMDVSASDAISQDEREEEEANAQEEDESDYEYDYEDEDEHHFTGFLLPTDDRAVSSISNPESSVANVVDNCHSDAVPSIDGDASRIVSVVNDVPPVAVAASSPTEDEDSKGTNKKKSTWREPSLQAVSMSLRAERERTGGKRRLATDLYKVMMGDTEEQGFSMEPVEEDSMERWRIKLFGFDEDSNLHKDMVTLGLDHIELEMSFPDQYPFEPPFVQVVRPRFKRQTGFVMNGALCMELLTKDGWNPINDIESVIVSVRSLLVVGDGRLAAAANVQCTEKKKPAKNAKAAKDDDEDALMMQNEDDTSRGTGKRRKARDGRAALAAFDDEDAERMDEDDDDDDDDECGANEGKGKKRSCSRISAASIGSYTAAEAKSAYSHLSDYHKKKGWDTSGWWARKG